MKKRIICVLLAVISIMSISTTACAEELTDSPKTTEPSSASSAKQPAKQEKKKQGFTGKKKKKGHTFYYVNGNRLKKGVHKYKGKYYMFSKKGDILKGWQKVKGKYSLFSRKSGRRISNRKVDGIRINKKGYAKKSKLNYRKIRTMMTARKIMLKITNPKDSKSVKRLKCFKWVMKFPYHRYRILTPIYKKKGWECTFANDTFKKHAGCCVSDACSTAFLFREIGYRNVYVCHDTAHAWASMGKRIYDPLFAQSKSFSANYNAVPTDYRIHAFAKRLIG